MTPLDLNSIGDMSDSEILEVVERELKWDENIEGILDNSKTYVTLNEMYIEALRYLEEELYYSREELVTLRRSRFLSKGDIVRFLRDTQNVKGAKKCVMAILLMCINDSYSRFNLNVEKVKAKTSGVLEKKLIHGIELVDVDNETQRGNVFLAWRRIQFTLRKREKSDRSATSKEIRDPDYYTAENIADFYGCTFEVDNKEDIIPLMQYISVKVFKKGVFDIKNKWLITEEDMLTTKSYLLPGFKNKLESSFDGQKKSSTWDKYLDIKLVSPLGKDDRAKNMSLEIKFVLSGNTNEKGVDMQGIYGYFKKISERIRLEGYVTWNYIETVVEKFLWDLPNILHTNINRKDKDLYTYQKELFNELKKLWHIDSKLTLKNPHVKSNIVRYLKKGLVSYYKSNKFELKEVRRRNGSNARKKLYTNDRALEVASAGLQKDIFIRE